MATLYVSNEATNGYVIGNDSNDGSTKALAKLTLESALTAAANNDTIVINDGTYDNAASFYDIANSGLTINPENDYQTTLTSANTTRVIYINTGGSGLTLGALIVDGEDATANCINGTTSNDIESLTINGTWLANSTAWSLTFVRLAALTAKNGWKMSGASTFGGINCDASAVVAPVGAFNIRDGSTEFLNLTDSGGNSSSVLLKGAVGMTTSIYNNEFIESIPSGTTPQYFVSCYGIPSVDIYNNTISRTGGVNYLSGVGINPSSVAITHCHVHDNTIILGDDAQTTTSYGIRVGTDSTGVDDNNISDAAIYYNAVKGCNHGVMLGWLTDGIIYGNSVSYAAIGGLLNGTTNCRAEGNFTDYITVQQFYNKAGTGDFLCNNLCILRSGYIGVPLYFGNESTIENTNATCVNNIAYSEVTINKWVQANNTSTLTDMSNNSFYSTVALPSNAFHWNGTNYNTLALFETGVSGAASNLETDPEFADFANGDYTVGSAVLATTGSQWWGLDKRPVGNDGEPFSDRSTSMGCVQLKDKANHPFHPENI